MMVEAGNKEVGGKVISSLVSLSRPPFSFSLGEGTRSFAPQRHGNVRVGLPRVGVGQEPVLPVTGWLFHPDKQRALGENTN